MAPPISFTKKTLDYPIFAADFDPYNRGYLVVGGGGGEGRSGVGNRITLLDVSSRGVITTAAEMELSRDEDAVVSLANLGSKDGCITYAGINSSEKAQRAGKNEHFRSFQIDYPSRVKDEKSEAENNEKEGNSRREGNISKLGKAAIFSKNSSASSEKVETYQRVLRLSPPQMLEDGPQGGNKRIGAFATGLAKENEIVVFHATSSLPNQAGDIIQRITPPAGVEATDIDIVDTFATPASTGSTFALAYCDASNIYVSHLRPSPTDGKAAKPKDPRAVYTIPFPDVFESGGGQRPTLRAIRFLGPAHIMALVNHPKTKRAELLVLLLPPPGEIGQAEEVRRVSLPRHMRVGVGLDVASLDADSMTGARQFIAGVAGQDGSTAVYKIGYMGPESKEGMRRPRKYAVFRDVHTGPITSVAFSPFHRPPSYQPSQGPASTEETRPKPPHPPPQYLRMATTSASHTVVVDAIPLSPITPKDPDSRYILQPSSAIAGALSTGLVYFMCISMVAVSLLCLQAYADWMTGYSGGALAQRKLDFFPPKLRSILAEMRPPGQIAHDMRAAARDVREKLLGEEQGDEAEVETHTWTSTRVVTSTATIEYAGGHATEYVDKDEL